MTEDEYRARRSHLHSINPMTADCPPADELEALRERFIEERTEELMEGLYDDPVRLQEYILESNYENTRMQLACKVLGKAIQSRSHTCADINLKMFEAFFEEAISNDATTQEAKT